MKKLFKKSAPVNPKYLFNEKPPTFDTPRLDTPVSPNWPYPKGVLKAMPVKPKKGEPDESISQFIERNK